MPNLHLTEHDLHTILASFLRSHLLTKRKAQFLFTQSDKLDALPSTPPSALGLTKDELQKLAVSFATMFNLPKEVADRLAVMPTLKDWAHTAFAANHSPLETIVFMTSGSTGIPTSCPQPFALLAQEIEAQAQIFTTRSRILTLVPRHHIYGFLFSVLLPKALDIPVVDLPPIPTTSMTEKMRDGDLVIAFPMFWKAMSQLEAIFPEGVHGVTSTGPCPAKVICSLLPQGLSRMTEVYGSSETGGMGTRNHPDDAYTLLPFWQPHPREVKNPAQLMRSMPNGEIIGPYGLPDHVAWEDARRFRPIKRTDKAVQVAGTNVYPEKVMKLINSHPLVVQCTARLMRPEEGDRLKAFIVPSPQVSEEAARRELRKWMEQNLAPVEIPKSITFGESLPANAMGKTADWEIER